MLWRVRVRVQRRKPAQVEQGAGPAGKFADEFLLGPKMPLLDCPKSAPAAAVMAVTSITALCEVRHIRRRVFRV